MTDIQQEKQEVIDIYNYFRASVLVNMLAKQELDVVDKAFNFAFTAHGDTRRKSGELYIYHPIAVAKISATELYLDCPAIAAAFLHDVVEDTEYGLDYLEKNFGKEIANIVDGLTKFNEKDAGIDEDKGTNQTNTIKKVITSLSYDPRVILVKLSDRLHNLRTIDSMPYEKQAKIASETKYIYAPLALRLGYYHVNKELEDLCMKITDPDVYYYIRGKMSVLHPDMEKTCNDFVSKVYEDIENEGIKITSMLQARSISEIWDQMNDNKLTFDQIDYKFNIKFVIDCTKNLEKFDCWRVYSILSEHFNPKPGGLQDMISTPKANGYESIHAVFLNDNGQWVKVLIRSTRMDDLAEKGVAGIWKHADDNHAETKLEQWIKAMIELMNNNTDNSIDFIEDFKSNLFTKEIFIYTPKGDVRTLPQGSTVLDLAYAISSQLGNSCAGAMVNKKLTAINTELKSGDNVEILTSANQTPKSSWLDYAKTPRALNHIKKTLNKIKRAKYDEGKKTVEDWLTENKLDVTDNNIDKVLKLSREESLVNLFYKVAMGNIPMESFRQYIQPEEKTNFFTNIFKPRVVTLKTSINEQINTDPNSLIINKDTSDLSYKTCKYCNPIPGDDVVGITNPDGAITIHRTNCERAVKLMTKYGNRVIKAKWQKQDKQAGFLAAISLEGIDRKGMTIEITNCIGQNFDLNIRDISLRAADGIFTGNISLYISNTDSLNQLISDIEKIDGITKVVRTNRTEK